MLNFEYLEVEVEMLRGGKDKAFYPSAFIILVFVRCREQSIYSW